MTSPALPHVQRDDVPLTEFTSTLTGRTVHMNPCTHQFLLLPGWHPQRLARAAEMCRQLFIHSKAHAGYTAGALITLRPLFAVTTRNAFADELEKVIGQMRWHAWERSSTLQARAPVNPNLRFRPAKPARNLVLVHSGALVASLWKQGLILCPVAEVAESHLLGSGGFRDCRSTEVFGDMVREIDLAIELLGETDRSVTFPKLLHLAMATSGASSLADFDEQALVSLRPVFATCVVSRAYRILDAMHRAHKTACANSPTLLAKIPPSYRNVLLKPRHGKDQQRSDPTFPWILREFPKFAAWQPMATAFVESIEGRLDLGADITVLSQVLVSLFRQPETPATPLSLCVASDAVGPQVMRKWLEGQRKLPQADRHLRVVSQFFEFVVGQTAPAHGMPDRRYSNPTGNLKAKRNRLPAQTHRIAMPPWLMRELRDVLFDPNETWARSLKGDYFTHVDPQSGRSSEMFSPVRLEFLRLRMLLPLRGLQVRLLDSGEADTERWEASAATPLNGEWVANSGPWASTTGPRREFGVLRKMYDPDSARYLTGLYISTNKTSDRRDFGAPGYVIPWESEEIIALVLRLSRWQEEFNPSIGPQKRTVIQKGRGQVSQDVEEILPGLHWLFRDAARQGHQHLPVGKGRLDTSWSLLLAHIEERLAERVRAGDPTARPVNLVLARNATGYPQSVAFDMHTIRVSGLTELQMAGCPIGVLQALAGHATWLMTMYYIKPSAADFKRELGAAQDRALTQMDAATWESLMADDSHQAWSELTVCNDDVALQYKKDTPRELWRLMDYGVCPAGGTLCNIGGELLIEGARDGHQYAPVKGGCANCTSCRFFLTGPALLGGLNARHAELQLEVVIAGERLRTAQAARRDLLSATASGNTPDTPTRIEAARRRLIRADAAVEEADDAAVTVSFMASSTLLLIRRCHNVIPSTDAMNAPSEDGKEPRLPMVAVGSAKDLQLAFTRCTDFELYTRICEDTEVYFGTDATNAAMRRAIRFDRVLAESGRPAVFSSLSLSDCVSVGNLYGRWLRTKLGEADASAVVEGQRTLAELGLLDESDVFLAQHRCGTIVAPPVITSDGTQRSLPEVT